MIEYKQYISLQKEYIKRKINEFLTEDMVNDDVTTNNTIKNYNKITAEIYALEKLILSSRISPHPLTSAFLSLPVILNLLPFLPKLHGSSV